MKIGINGINIKGEKKKILKSFIEFLESKNFTIYFSTELDNCFSKSTYKTYNSKNIKKLNFIISLGGDGTLLNTVTHVGKSNTKILGVNIGKLGFLSFDVHDVFEKIIDDIINNNYSLEKRSLVTLKNLNNKIEKNFALNEISVIKKDSSSMIKIQCYIDNKFICTYWSDGLIISTPTGSTGYSLSCGGPILTPNNKNLLITPISPHNLGLRSLIISDESKIKLKIENQKYNFLVSMDSRSYTFKGEQEFVVEKSKFYVNLIHPNNFDFFETLRKKLNWGFDLRN
ncbi:MAG: NAD kinase [Cytophagales bacterium]|nr:MAG: NAD kinase [Rhodothermaeota bacterium MED-G16]|tara:strand:- start:154 stop:1008 length:855 start_codon:yes stop_codon:yes gene_type:complete